MVLLVCKIRIKTLLFLLPFLPNNIVVIVMLVVSNE